MPIILQETVNIKTVIRSLSIKHEKTGSIVVGSLGKWVTKFTGLKMEDLQNIIVTGGAGFTPWNGAQFHRASRSSKYTGINIGLV